MEASNIASSSGTSGNELGRFGNHLKQLIQYPVPRHLLHTSEGDTTRGDEEELSTRKSDRKEFLRKRTETSAALDRAKEDMSEFQELLAAYQAADNVKSPSAEETETINIMNTSVSNVVVDASGSGSLIARKIAAKTLQLDKAREAARNAWDKACKVNQLLTDFHCQRR